MPISLLFDHPTTSYLNYTWYRTRTVRSKTTPIVVSRLSRINQSGPRELSAFSVVTSGLPKLLFLMMAVQMESFTISSKTLWCFHILRIMHGTAKIKVDMGWSGEFECMQHIRSYMYQLMTGFVAATIPSFAFTHSPQVKEPLLAIKQPFSKKRELFQKERDMLSTLATKNHPHLIQLLATYEHNGSFHFMFPFANANLRVYWEETGVPYWNKETYLWFLRQICGLASGLDNIHEFNATKSPLGSEPTNARAKAAFGKFLAVEDGEEKFGRHGDIKPENILWFNELPQAGKEGVLQITDMGLGRFHRLDSRSKATAHFIGGSPTYMPPEVLLRKLASRAYDVWSMGCVFLEFITWLLEGPQVVEEFTSARGMTAWDGTYDDVYFTVIVGANGKSAAVREGVTLWFGRLRKHPRCSPMIADLLAIVENQMLVVESEHRVRSSILVRTLQSLYVRAIGSSEYLLGEDISSSDVGKGVKIPSGPKTLYATPRRSSDKPLIPMPNSSPTRAPTHSIEIVLPEGHLEESIEPPFIERPFAQESLPPTPQSSAFSTPVQRFTSFGLNQKRRRHSNPYER